MRDAEGRGPDFPFGEPFSDISYNSRYDGPYDPWVPGIPFIDVNGNSRFDPYYVIRDSSEPAFHIKINRGESRCFQIPFTPGGAEVVGHVLPNGDFDPGYSTVCWTPQRSGKQTVTVTIEDNWNQKDTLDVSVFVSFLPSVDSVKPHTVVRGSDVILRVFYSDAAYPTLQPDLPIALVDTSGALPWAGVSISEPEHQMTIQLRISEQAPIGPNLVGVRVPGVLTGGKKVPGTVAGAEHM